MPELEINYLLFTVYFTVKCIGYVVFALTILRGGRFMKDYGWTMDYVVHRVPCPLPLNRDGI
jgi:hypothetical protein